MKRTLAIAAAVTFTYADLVSHDPRWLGLALLASVLGAAGGRWIAPRLWIPEPERARRRAARAERAR